MSTPDRDCADETNIYVPSLVDLVLEWRSARQAWFDWEKWGHDRGVTQEERNSIVDRLANAEDALMKRARAIS